MDMDMSIVHVTYPLWFRVSVTTVAIFAFVGVALVRRSSHPLLVLGLPVVFTLALSYLGAADVALGLSIAGASNHAAAAGAADCVVVFVYGLGVAAFVAAVSGFRVRDKSSAGLSQTAVTILGSVFLLLAGGATALISAITRHQQIFSPGLANLGRLGAALTFILLIGLAVIAFRPVERPLVVRRVTFFSSAAAFAAVAISLSFVAGHFREIAMSG